MEKYLTVVFLLVPGFLALQAATILGQTEKESKTEYALSYIAFGTVGNLVTISIAVLVGILPSDTPLAHIADIPLWQSVALAGISIIASVCVGAGWAGWISDYALAAGNWLAAKRGMDPYYNGPLLVHMFEDGKPHFLIIKKDGEDIGVGFFKSVDHATQAIALYEHPAYRKELAAARAGTPSYLVNTLQTYYDANIGLLIYETEYPPAWGEAAG